MAAAARTPRRFRRPSMRARVCLPLLLLAACGLPAGGRGDGQALLTGEIGAWTRPDGDAVVLTLGARGVDGSMQPLAELRGVRLVLDESGGERLLPFQAAQPSGDGLALSCRDHPSHGVRVALHPTDQGTLALVVEDRVGLQSRVLELTLDYRLLGPEPVSEAWTPHVQRGTDELVGDAAFHLPLAFLRAGRHALGVAPDVALLNRQRRIPQGMELDRQLHRVRHGLIVHQVAASGERVAFRREGEPVSVRGETLRFGHELFLSVDADRSTLGAVAAALWDHHAGWFGESGGVPLDESLDDLADRAFRELMAADWAETELGGRAVGTLASGRAVRLGLPALDAWFTHRRQSMRTACALDLFAERTGRPTPGTRAAQMVELLLAAPRRGGLLPAVVALDLEAGRLPTAPDAGNAEGRRDHYRVLDTATTAYWLLRLFERDPENREELLVVCRAAARFLMDNQLQNGAVPAFVDARFLAPRRGPLYDSGFESAGVARFLAEYGRIAGDAEATAASERAVALLERLLERGEILDGETTALLRGTAMAGAAGRSEPPPEGSMGLIFAAGAAVALAQQAATAARETIEETAVAAAKGRADAAMRRATAFLERLTLFQQLWSRNWLPPAGTGGLTATNLDLSWSDPRQALAAEVWLSGYELTGRRDFLQRGVAAMRAGLGTVDAGDPHWDGAAAVATAELARDLLGQGVVDLAGPFAEGIDSVWFQGLQVLPGEIRFQLLSRAPLEQARILFRSVPRDGGPYRLVVNGQLRDGVPPDEFERGVLLPVRRVPRLRFLPPAEIRADVPWEPRVEFSGPLDPDARVYLEVHAGELTERVPLDVFPEPGRLGGQSFEPLGLGLGAEVRMRILLEGDGYRVTEPARGFRSVTLAAMHCVDPGDDDEQYLDLEASGPSAIDRYADGREGCRTVDQGGSIVYRLPVPSTSARLRLEVLLRGATRITVGGNVLHEDLRAVDQERQIRLTVADRRLWADGTVALGVTAVDQRVQLARIRYLPEGQAALPEETGDRKGSGRLVPTLRIAVVPLSLQDTPLASSPESIRQAFFAGPGYRLTAPPNSARTAGSVAHLMAAMSGGLTSLAGSVTEILSLEDLAAELGQEPEAARRRLIDEVLRHSEARSGQTDPDVVVAVHGRNETLLGLGAGAGAGTADATPVIFLPDRGPDGSFLAGGTALAAILTARYGLTPLEDASAGAFGQLALTGGGAPHIPSGPAGTNLERIGWADRIELEERDQNGLVLPVLQEGRAFYVLPCRRLPGRGDLVVERREEGAGEPGLGTRGTLIYWDLRAGSPILTDETGRATRARFLRLSARPGARQTPFEPGTGEDLFRGELILSERSAPALVTPQGDHVWSLALRSIGSGGRLDLRYHPRELAQWHRGVWTTARRGGPRLPLPVNAQEPELGWVVADEQTFWLRPGAAAGDRVRGSIPTPWRHRVARLFATLDTDPGPGPVALRVGCDDELLLHARLEPGRRDIPIEVDLPVVAAGAAGRIWIEAENPNGDTTTIRVARCVTVPRQPARFRLGDDAPKALTRPMAAWTDGGYHSEVLRLDAAPEGNTILLPLVLPETPSRLRIVAGLEQSLSPETRAVLSVNLRNREGSWRETILSDLAIERGPGQQPGLTALLELPAFPEGRVAMLELTLVGPTDAVLHIQSAEIVGY